MYKDNKTVHSWLLFITLVLALVATAEGGKKYMDFEEKGRKMAQAIEQYQGGQLAQCINWAKHAESEVIKKMTHKSGTHLFSKDYPACPLNHKTGRLRHAKKDKDGVLITSKDSLEMCQCIGKLMEMGRLPTNIQAVEESGLILLNVGAASSRGTDMSVAHHIGFESYNYEPGQREYVHISQNWKNNLAESPRTHVIQAAATYVQGGEGTIQMAKETGNMVGKETGDKKKKKKKPEMVTVPAVSLDYAMRDATKRVAFIHVDVHGQEYEVLKGAYGILVKDKPAVFFQHSANLKGGAARPAHVMCYMKNLGYDCGFYEKKSSNVICTHPQQFHFKPTIKKQPKKGKGKEGMKQRRETEIEGGKEQKRETEAKGGKKQKQQQ